MRGRTGPRRPRANRAPLCYNEAMSTTGISDPAFYSYPSTLPAGLEPSTASTSTSTTSSSSTTTPPESPYQLQYNALQQYDNQELFAVTFASPQAAAANVTAVLAQWAGIQAGQQASWQQSQLTQANAAISGALPAESTINVPTVPSMSDIVGQSEQQANAALTAYAQAPPGSSILDFQA